jgi:glycosyltransferase involved in cell wall biosynthesis
MTAVRAIAVVIPARNESALIDACLQSVLEARSALLAQEHTKVTVTVVADGCTDDTFQRASRFPGVDVLPTRPIGVGAARRLGVRRALDRVREPPRKIWIANTDADSVVDRSWLVNQATAAQRGIDVRIGAVQPHFHELTRLQLEAWHLRHRDGEARGHVHGANLGMRGSTYLIAGGFRTLELHEDVDLVARAVAMDAAIATEAVPDVFTSARPVGRAPGGYASYLSNELSAVGRTTAAQPADR